MNCMREFYQLKKKKEHIFSTYFVWEGIFDHKKSRQRKV